MGILIALIPALGWGIQPLIIGKIGGKPENQILGTGIGALIVGAIVYFFFSPPAISMSVFLISLLSGAFWVVGQTGQYKALEIMGVSKTMPITTGLQLVGTSLISVIAFGEWPGLTNKLIGLVAILLLIAGAVLTSVNDSASGKSNMRSGFMVLLATSVGYWIYSALPRLVNAPGLSIFFPQMLGIFIGAVIYVLVKRPQTFKESKSWLTSIVGLTFSISALAYIFSAQANGVATAFIITQLNVVVATLGGMFFLKEQKTPKELRFTLIGLALIVIGSVITVFI